MSKTAISSGIAHTVQGIAAGFIQQLEKLNGFLAAQQGKIIS
jgi:hypothetical protein